MLYKLSFFIGATITSFLDNGFSFSWQRIKYQYKRSLYFNGHVDKINTDFYKIIESLKQDEGFIFYYIDSYLDYSYHFSLYTKKDFWYFSKFEGVEDKTNYQRLSIKDTNFDEKMNLLEKPDIIKQRLIKLNKVKKHLAILELPHSNPEDVRAFKEFIHSHLFEAPYKAEM